MNRRERRKQARAERLEEKRMGKLAAIDPKYAEIVAREPADDDEGIAIEKALASREKALVSRGIVCRRHGFLNR